MNPWIRLGSTGNLKEVVKYDHFSVCRLLNARLTD